MALPSPILLSSTSATLQFIELATGVITPPTLTFTVGSAAVIGATTIAVTIAGSVGVVLASTTIADGTYIEIGSGTTRQVAVVVGDQLGTATSLVVEPLKKAIASAATFTCPAGITPLIGLEGANLQISKATNDVVLLATLSGNTTRSYSALTWQFSGNLYIPTSATLANPAQRIDNALLLERYLWVERFDSVGNYAAGIGLVTDVSDNFSGSNFITKSLTIMGSGVLTRRFATA